MPKKYNPTRRDRQAEIIDQSIRIDDVNRNLKSEYVNEEVETNPTTSVRKTRLIQYTIFCEMCEKGNKIATRYPGQIPRICDECYSKYKTPAAAKAALYDKQHPDAAKHRKQRHAEKKKQK